MSVDRIELLRRGFAEGATVLEVGPLDNPVLAKSDYDVVYLDYTEASELRHKYADDVTRKEIVDVDHIWNGSTPLPADVVARGPYDGVVASHVLEHIPDPVSWLAHFAAVLRPGALMSLALPDKRFTFDVNRRLTEFSDLLDAYLTGVTRPSYAQLFDYHTKALPVDCLSLWTGMANYTGQVRPGDLHEEAYDGCVALSQGGPYVDVHCHTFTPPSFVDLIEELGRFDLIDYALGDLTPTEFARYEFYVQLVRLDPADDADTRRRQRQEGVARARRAIEDGPAPAVHPTNSTGASAPQGATWYLVGDRERRLLDAKRNLVTRIRATARRAGGRR